MLSFRDVSVEYGKRKVLEKVSFDLVPHKITALIGKNGCGKSTLVSCVNGQVKYTGSILYSDRSVALMGRRERARLTAILPQLLGSPSLSVEELVAMGRTPYLDLGRRMTQTDRKYVEEAIACAGLEEMRKRPLLQLSGGERQKAYLAMVLAQNTRIIILDEPTTYMDMAYQAEFLRLLDTLKNRHKKTLMVVMHDLTQAVASADNIVLLHEGGVRFFGTARECVESGLIEQIFHVKKCIYEEDGQQRILYHG